MQIQIVAVSLSHQRESTRRVNKIRKMLLKMNFYDGPGSIEMPEEWLNCPVGSEGEFFLKELSKFDQDTAARLKGVQWAQERDENGRKLVWGGHTYEAMAGSHAPFAGWHGSSNRAYGPVTGIRK